MSTATIRKPFQIQCDYRPLILAATALVLRGVFWFASRYPQLFNKAQHHRASVAEHGMIDSAGNTTSKTRGLFVRSDIMNRQL